MIRIRKAAERGHFDHGWLDTRHTFSFGRYHDPRHMGFRALRVMNEDWVKPGEGFGAHPHRDMEIVTYVLDGALEHRDSLGDGGTIRPGELQRMTAGTGIVHSEANPSTAESVHLYQIWLLPERGGIGSVLRAAVFPRIRAAQPVAAGRVARWTRRFAHDPTGCVALSRHTGCGPRYLAPAGSRAACLASGAPRCDPARRPDARRRGRGGCLRRGIPVDPVRSARGSPGVRPGLNRRKESTQCLARSRESWPSSAG